MHSQGRIEIARLVNNLIIARYSALKVAGWVTLAVTAAVWLLVDGASRGWRPPEDRYAWLFPMAILGAIYFLITAAAMVANFVLVRGVAIAAVGNEFVLYYLWSRKHVALQPGLWISDTGHEIEVPDFAAAPFLKAPRIFTAQVTIGRRGQPNLIFRTGLLREPAQLIAERMSTLAGLQ